MLMKQKYITHPEPVSKKKYFVGDVQSADPKLSSHSDLPFSQPLHLKEKN
jgi:hypothetical protein